MSLDVFLYQNMQYQKYGETITVEQEVFCQNITHNLNKMAFEAGVYEAMWRPEEKGWSKAKDIAPVLELGLERLLADPDKYKALNPQNGWGNYDGLVAFVIAYLEACKEYPESFIRVSR